MAQAINLLNSKNDMKSPFTTTSDYYNTNTNFHKSNKSIDNTVNTISIKSASKPGASVLVTREMDFSRLKPIMLPQAQVRKFTNACQSYKLLSNTLIN